MVNSIFVRNSIEPKLIYNKNTKIEKSVVHGNKAYNIITQKITQKFHITAIFDWCIYNTYICLMVHIDGYITDKKGIFNRLNGVLVDLVYNGT